MTFEPPRTGQTGATDAFRSRSYNLAGMPAPSFETLLYTVEDSIATIALNRPEKLNAFTTTMMLELIAAFDATDADDAVRAVVVTGSGRAFCAGADLGTGGATFDYASELARADAALYEAKRSGRNAVRSHVRGGLPERELAVSS